MRDAPDVPRVQYAASVRPATDLIRSTLRPCAGGHPRGPRGTTMTAFAGSRREMNGPVYDLSGGDWQSILSSGAGDAERVQLNFGPSHPSSHGVLRLVLTLDGETIADCRPVVGYLHTGIEKASSSEPGRRRSRFSPAPTTCPRCSPRRPTPWRLRGYLVSKLRSALPGFV